MKIIRLCELVLVSFLILGPQISRGENAEVENLFMEANNALKGGDLQTAKNRLKRACSLKSQVRCDYSWGLIFDREHNLINAKRSYLRYLQYQEQDTSPQRDSRVGWIHNRLKQIEPLLRVGQSPADNKPRPVRPAPPKGANSTQLECPKPAPCEICPKVEESPELPGATLAVLRIKNDVPGALISNLRSYPKGLTIAAGITEIIEPVGSRRLVASVPDVKNIEINISMEAGKVTEADIAWRNNFITLSSSYGNQKFWERFLHGNYAPGFFASPPRLEIVLMSMGFVLLSGSLVGMIACGINCQPRDYVSGLVPIGAVGLAGLGLGIAGIFLVRAEKSPFRPTKPGLDSEGHRAQRRYW